MIRFDFDGLDAVQVRLADLAAEVDGSRLLADLGRVLFEQTEDRIRTRHVAPRGAAWAPKRGGTSSTLQESGALVRTLEHILAGDEVEVGSALPYARYLQDGTSNMPARPFLGIGAEDELELEELGAQFLLEELAA